MTSSGRSWIVFGLATAALGGSAVLVGMANRPSLPDASITERSFDYSTSTLHAKDLLKTELVRRFSDLSVPEVGMSRLTRPATTHGHAQVLKAAYGPRRSRWRGVGGGEMQLQVRLGGEWIKETDYKPTLTPENEQEEAITQQFEEARVDVALYTMGQFELDRGAKPDLNDPSFSYEHRDSIRVNGPAYLRKDSANAPRASEMVNFARLAWASQQTDYSGKGKNGWVYFAHRVDANDSKCASCHGNRNLSVNGQVLNIKGIVQKEGDPVGLFVIALRKSNSK